MLYLNDMAMFVLIIDRSGFQKAAHELGVAKSSVSRRLALLETHLGVQLISRTTRRLELTE